MRKMTALLAATLLAFAPTALAASHTLSYSQAKHAAQKRGNATAGKRVKVTSLFRSGPRSYFAQVKWTKRDPNGCKGCGYDPDTDTTYDTPSTSYCFADINVKRSARTGRITARLQDRSCS